MTDTHDPSTASHDFRGETCTRCGMDRLRVAITQWCCCSDDDSLPWYGWQSVVSLGLDLNFITPADLGYPARVEPPSRSSYLDSTRNESVLFAEQQARSRERAARLETPA